MVQPEPEPERKNSISEKKSSSPNHNAGPLRKLIKQSLLRKFIKNEECDYKKASHSEGEDNGPRDVPGRKKIRKLYTYKIIKDMATL